MISKPEDPAENPKPKNPNKNRPSAETGKNDSAKSKAEKAEDDLHHKKDPILSNFLPRPDFYDPANLWLKIRKRVFSTREYFHLWSAQAVTGLGDWLGFFAFIAAATHLGGNNPTAAISFVLSARLIPGLFLTPITGVIADRVNRKRLMIICDISRVLLIAAAPFVDSLWQLFVVALLVEVFTLLWIPAKEAILPNLLPAKKLSNANSLSLIAAYGTFPLASAMLLGLAPLGEYMEDIGSISFLKINADNLAFYVDAATFALSALFLSFIPTAKTRKGSLKVPEFEGFKPYLVQIWTEIKDGWSFIAKTPIVRVVNIGLATALIGVGLLIPLGRVFVEDVLNAGATGYSGMLLALGVGAGVGVVFLTLMRRHFSLERIFILANYFAGLSLIIAISLDNLIGAIFAIGFVGAFASWIYVCGFTLLHDRTTDEVRGRVFAALNSLIRLFLFLTLVVGPLLSSGFDFISNWILDGEANLGSFEYPLPGLRFTLWLAGLIILSAGWIVSRLLLPRKKSKPSS